ncbi:unnamed protein product [Strongylus vulgaris]|uniref:Uncharacterized protein n=1 Tax=Strongylus vulgaris TaxID=40348 RepID=A0A3P7INE6_STRVU|nr:unnamed protein product [Strongylus vulgaris]
MFSAWIRTQAIAAKIAAANDSIENVSPAKSPGRTVPANAHTVNIDRAELDIDQVTEVKTDWTKKCWKNPSEIRSKKLRKQG